VIRAAGGISLPARLTRALAIDGGLNGKPATPQCGLWFEEGEGGGTVIATPPIGVAYAGPRWSARKLRFVLRSS
jgi:DNA-3-methyladenine glycosylase